MELQELSRTTDRLADDGVRDRGERGASSSRSSSEARRSGRSSGTGAAPKAFMWIDGSCGRNGGLGAWAAVTRGADGNLGRCSGVMPSGASSVEAELLGLLHGLDLVPDDVDVDVISDCKSLCDAVQGGIDSLNSPSWGLMVARLSERKGRVTARWKPRKKSQGMIAAHYLANAARAFGEMGLTVNGAFSPAVLLLA
jgi:ribonuclease HI